MNSAVTLDLWANPPASIRTAVLDMALRAGSTGFTVDDLRFRLRGDFPRNPGSVLGSLCARGVLRAVLEEPSRIPSSKHRRVRRFVLASEVE